jgi:hypothetical protein
MTDTYRDLVNEDSPVAVAEPESGLETEPARYFIDTDWYDRSNRSFRAMGQGRFCTACQAKVGDATQERVPTVDKKTSRVVYETRDVRYGEQPMQVIRTCCSKQRNYITPETPVLEAVFRVFLASGNQPSTVERVREQLGDWISLRDRPHGYSGELIERLIQNDHRYGLRAFEMQAEA